MIRRAAVIWLGALVLVAIILAVVNPSLVGASPESANSGDSEADNRLIRPHSPILGPEDAPVTIVEFFDPACEACRAFHPFIKRILEVYPEEVKLVVRYTPFHGEVSETAIRVLEVARRQDVFQPVLEALLARQSQWASHGSFDEAAIMEVASQAGLDEAMAQQQLASTEVQAVLEQDREDVKANQISQTPTFFVNGELLAPFGMQELVDAVQRQVDELSNDDGGTS